MDQQTEKDTTERITGLGRRTRDDIAKWNKMTALRFQTGGNHQTSPASRPHKPHMIMTSQSWSKYHRHRPCFRNFQTSILNKMINQLKNCCKCFFFIYYIYLFISFLLTRCVMIRPHFVPLNCLSAVAQLITIGSL